MLSSNKNSFFILYFLANKHKIDGFDLVHGLLFELLISDPSFRGKKKSKRHGCEATATGESSKDQDDLKQNFGGKVTELSFDFIEPFLYSTHIY